VRSRLHEYSVQESDNFASGGGSRVELLSNMLLVTLLYHLLATVLATSR
jgi:hypothetical protein